MNAQDRLGGFCHIPWPCRGDQEDASSSGTEHEATSVLQRLRSWRQTGEAPTTFYNRFIHGTLHKATRTSSTCKADNPPFDAEKRHVSLER